MSNRLHIFLTPFSIIPVTENKCALSYVPVGAYQAGITIKFSKTGICIYIN